jgi:hypothetical protein
MSCGDNKETNFLPLPYGQAAFKLAIEKYGNECIVSMVIDC